jgi:hypothetical protein
MILGWTAVIGMAAWIFYGTVSGKAIKANSQRRRKRRRSKRNSGYRRNINRGYRRNISKRVSWRRPGRHSGYRKNRRSRVAGIHSRLRAWGIKRNRLGAATELKIWDAVGLVREAKTREQLSFLPPGVAAKVKAKGPGIYRYGYGRKGEALIKYKTDDLNGVLTSARIASSKSGETHYVIDNRGGYPVVIRIMDTKGRTQYRVEEYAKKLSKVLVAKRASASAAAGWR